MITRAITLELETLLGEYPVVTILGPRQAGKTTLARHGLEGFAYSNLESPEVREFARADPRAYLAQFREQVIIDEIQHVPELLSYLQVEVDENPRKGRFILTGSHQLEVRQAITQSLAGRTAILNLLPLSIAELAGAGIRFDSFAEYALHGFLPRIHDQGQRPTTAYSNYYQTYVERDVRQIVRLKDASLFEKLMRLLAGRVGQLVDYSSLANDVGVDAKTIRHWISILEASFLLFKLPPYFENFGKRAIKSPKLYFTDVGLLCYLLGIREAGQVTRDPLVGGIFENLVVMECVKARYNRGKPADFWFFRDSNGNEVDLVWQDGRALAAAEIKSASTFSMSLLKGLGRFRGIVPQFSRGVLVYNGDPRILSDGTDVRHFTDAQDLFGSDEAATPANQ
ncbi:MAG: ATP-binding protein [Verrucomicrobiales bacterium]|nr:ATP-binding protein [Verrucomicrobiales bacterium]MDP4639084.1 ATP-binding protein [Verrucomicrobiales bacterium]MDP4792237.1 ATP-binding protein [Verrucomicrobiales bacterium]MDP4940391.1 ATP-binding protein [Verrucomicrobiales bacterium]MDP5007243.1 ATP-binding protein [Verrucomicrobiales bacterium]